MSRVGRAFGEVKTELLVVIHGEKLENGRGEEMGGNDLCCSKKLHEGMVRVVSNCLFQSQKGLNIVRKIF